MEKLTKKQKAHRKFIASNEWRDIRKHLFTIREKRCEICGSVRYLQVHHLNYDRFGGDELPEDLQILCGHHHRLAHGLKKKRRNKKRKKKQEYSYKGILKIYPAVMMKDISRHNKAIEFQKIFNTGKKLRINGRIRKKQCNLYLKKVERIYNRHLEKANRYFDDDTPCWHYVN